MERSNLRSLVIALGDMRVCGYMAIRDYTRARNAHGALDFPSFLGILPVESRKNLAISIERK